MESFVGYDIGLFINDATISPDPTLISFTISDNIYKLFPLLNLSISDDTGLFLEGGIFTQGISLKLNYGISSTSELLDVDFKASRKDVISSSTGIPGLNGNLSIKGLHNSFFNNRESPHLAIKDLTVAEALKKVFSFEKNIKIEDTKGKIEAYAVNDPYQFVQDILLPQATNGKVRPYAFFRNLLNELHFESISLLEANDESEKLAFGSLSEDEDDTNNTIFSFLPFEEGLQETLPSFSVIGRFLKNDLSLGSVEKSVATDANNKIPVITDTRIHNGHYFNRQFNPNVSYDQINNGLFANAMKSSYFISKALCALPFHPNLVAGKTVSLSVSLTGSDQKTELSETYSGKWLIEQSSHTWNGIQKKGQTTLILCRSSVLPRKGSIIIDKGFADK